MALVSEISAVTHKYIIPKLVDNIFASNALLQRWRKKKTYETIDGGTKITQPVLYATTTAAGWYTGNDTLSTTNNDQVTEAEWDWKQAYANITISRLDELKNSGVKAIINYVKAKAQAAEKTLADNLGTGIFNAGTTTNAIIGLRLMVTGTGSTYGNLSKTTYSWWRSTVDSTSTTLTIPLIRGLTGDVQIDSDKPTVYATTQDIYDDLYGLIQPQERFADKDTADAGFTNIMFEGKPVVVDSHCPASHFFALNEDYISLKAHKDENFRFEPFIKPTNQNVSTAKIYWAGNLTCSNCRMQGLLSAIA